MDRLCSGILPVDIECPHCGASMKLDDQERIEKKFDCPACNNAIDLSGQAQVQSSIDLKKKRPQECSTGSNKSSPKDEEDFCCSDCGSSITYGDLTCSKCGAVLEYECDQNEHAHLDFHKNKKVVPLDSRVAIISGATESSPLSAGNVQTPNPTIAQKISLHGDYNESKSHRFLVRLFGAVGFWLACYWIISYVATLVGYLGGPWFHLAILSIGGTAAFQYVRHEWRESKRLEREWEETKLKTKNETKDS